MSEDIFIRKSGYIGHITLNRPDVLNSLTYSMILSIEKALIEWETDENIALIIIDAEGDRAFCAGGDIRDLYNMAVAGEHDRIAVCFRAEYMAHMAVCEFPKPLLSLANGIVMGGGAGLMQAGSHAIVSDTTRFAMPESAIGLYPDAGASVFIGRCPRSLALYLGMTGKIIGAADCLMLGLANAMVPSADVTALKDALLACSVDEIDDVVTRYRSDPGPAPLQAGRTEIDYIFAGDEPAVMRDRAGDMARLKESRLAEEVHTALTTRCPMTSHVFMRLIDGDHGITDMPSALMLDYHLAIRMTRRTDFMEGVRAVIIEKSNDAVWQPARLEDVTSQDVDEVFDRSGLPALR